jgi:hypothetical protein
MDAKKVVTEYTPRFTQSQLDERSMNARISAMDKALRCEKVRYKSKCDPEKFKEFLEHRLTIWEDQKDKTFHAKKMYEKTLKLIDVL